MLVLHCLEEAKLHTYHLKFFTMVLNNLNPVLHNFFTSIIYWAYSSNFITFVSDNIHPKCFDIRREKKFYNFFLLHRHKFRYHFTLSYLPNVRARLYYSHASILNAEYKMQRKVQMSHSLTHTHKHTHTHTHTRKHTQRHIDQNFVYICIIFIYLFCLESF